MNANGKTQEEYSAPPNGAQAVSPLARHLRELAAEVEALKAAGPASPSDTLAHWLSAHYAAAARKAAEEAGEAGMPLDTLRSLTADVVALRRGDHHAARLKIERERLDLETAATATQKEAEFWAWTRRPEIREKLLPPNIREAHRRRIREVIDHFMLGTPLPPDTEPEAPCDPAAMI